MNYILIITGIILLIITIVVLGTSTTSTKQEKDYQYYVNIPLKYMINNNPATLEEIIKLEPDFDLKYFLFLVLSLFKETQNAWSNRDLTKLKQCVGSDLFDVYEKVMIDFKAKGQKNMIYDIVLLNSKLCSFSIEDGIRKAEVLLTVSCYDYLVTTSSQRIITGNNERKLTITYVLSLEKVKEKQKELENCPNCKQFIKEDHTICCPFCNQELIPNTFAWVITDKKILKQTEF